MDWPSTSAARDLDLLGFGEPGIAPVRATFQQILRFEVADDGVQFDLDSLRVGLIREEQEYGVASRSSLA